MKTLKRIDPKSLAKIFGITYAFFALIFSVLMTIISVVEMVVSNSYGQIWVTLGLFVLAPVIYGVLGWVGGYLSAWIYNFVAKKVGGVKYEEE